MKIIIDRELFQWDKNRCVSVQFDNNEESPSILQFYNKKSSKAKECVFSKDKNIIPNELLKSGLPVTVLACLAEGEETKVLCRKEFKVLARPKPESYVDDDLAVEIIYDGGVET